jgi:hypothetical protein
MTKKFSSTTPVSRRNHSGNPDPMRRFIGSGVAWTIAFVAAWRAASELLERRARLLVDGELAPRLAARRLQLLERALVRAGIREPQRVLVAVSSGVDLRAHASVYVGRAGLGADIDDVGLLEGAMRRAAAERMDVSATGVSRRRRSVRRPAHRAPAPRSTPRSAERPSSATTAAAVLEPTSPRARPAVVRPSMPSTNWRRVLADADVVRHDDGQRADSDVPVWAIPLGVLGALLTFVPL